MRKHTTVSVLDSQLISVCVHCDLDLWPLTSKIKRVHPLTIVNISAKFDEEIHNGLVSIVFTSLFPYMCPLWPWPLTSKIKRVHPLTMANMSAKFDQETHNGLGAILFTSLFPYMSIVTLTFDLWVLQNQKGPSSHHGSHFCQVWSRSTRWFRCYHVHKLISIYVNYDLDLWLLTSKINRVHPLTMVNMSAKFDREIHNGLVSIVFTSLFPYSPLWPWPLSPPKSTGSIILPWLTCLPSLIKKYTTV